MPTPAVVVEDLVRTYPGGFRAVDGVDLAWPRRDLRLPRARTARARARWSGCSPRCCARPAGRPGRRARRRPRRRAVRRAIGVALQDAAIDPYMTGRELLRCRAPSTGFAGRGGRRAPRSCSTGSTSSEPPTGASATYSGGMRRRLDLALALVHRPRCCSSTSRRPAWTRSAAWRCGARCARSTTRARRSSSPPSTWRRPTSSRTAWGSSTAAARRRGHARPS